MKQKICDRCKGFGFVDWIKYAQGLSSDAISEGDLLLIKAWSEGGRFDLVQRKLNQYLKDTDVTCPKCKGSGELVVLTSKEAITYYKMKIKENEGRIK